MLPVSRTAGVPKAASHLHIESRVDVSMVIQERTSLCHTGHRQMSDLLKKLVINQVVQVSEPQMWD